MANTLQTNNQITPANNNQQKGTGYTNLQSILNANNGSALGQNLVKNVNQNVGNTVNAVQGANNQFGQQTSSEENRINQLQGGAQTALNQVINAPGSTQANQNLVNSQDVNNYNNYASTGYQGPTGLNNITGLQNQQTNSQNYANLLGSQAGQQQLLRTFVNQPNYTNSEQNLDSLILGGQPIQSNLQQAKSQALSQLAQNNVNNFQTSAQQQAALNQQALGQGQNALTNQATQFGNTVNQNVQNQLNNLQNQSNAATTNYGTLNSGNYGAVDANGNPLLNNAQYDVFNAAKTNNFLNPSSYLNLTQANDLTNAGAATQQQAAQLAALGQLTKNNGLALTPTAGGNIGDATAANLNVGNIIAAAQQAANPYLNTFTARQIQQGIAPNLSTIDPTTAAAFNNLLNQRVGLGSNPTLGNENLNQLSGSNNTPAITQDAAAIQQFINKYFGIGNPATQPNNTVVGNTANNANIPVVKG